MNPHSACAKKDFKTDRGVRPTAITECFHKLKALISHPLLAILARNKHKCSSVVGDSTALIVSAAQLKDHRHVPRHSVIVRRNSLPSFFERMPASDNNVLRLFSRSASPCRKFSIASPRTHEIPFCPLRVAMAIKALRCSGLISAVVRTSKSYLRRQIRLLAPVHLNRYSPKLTQGVSQ